MENTVFYGFRGSMIFPKQISMYNIGLENNSECKNKIFNDFFEKLEKEKKLTSRYQNRVYYMIFKNKYENIIHCQLARRKKFYKRELKENDIVEMVDDDYPYVNIFIKLDSQMFFIESKTYVYQNYNTCSRVISNIINNNLNIDGITIVLENISDEQDFWKYFNGEIKVYKLVFNLVYPNIFKAADAASNFVKEAQEVTGADNLEITFENSKGDLKVNKEREGINSFVKYTSAGGGKWSIHIKNENNRKVKITSCQSSVKETLPVSNRDLNEKKLTIDQLTVLKYNFDKIETVERFKKHD